MALHRVLLTNYLSGKALVIDQETVILIFRLLTLNYGKHSLNRYQGPHI